MLTVEVPVVGHEHDVRVVELARLAQRVDDALRPRRRPTATTPAAAGSPSGCRDLRRREAGSVADVARHVRDVGLVERGGRTAAARGRTGGGTSLRDRVPDAVTPPRVADGRLVDRVEAARLTFDRVGCEERHVEEERSGPSRLGADLVDGHVRVDVGLVRVRAEVARVAVVVQDEVVVPVGRRIDRRPPSRPNRVGSGRGGRAATVLAVPVEVLADVDRVVARATQRDREGRRPGPRNAWNPPVEPRL